MPAKWSKIELKRLRDYAKRGLTARCAADLLRRPYIATRVKASEQRIKFNSFAR